jgi:hypothetical protein
MTPNKREATLRQRVAIAQLIYPGSMLIGRPDSTDLSRSPRHHRTSGFYVMTRREVGTAGEPQ